MRIAIIGATGLVGKIVMKVLEERNFPVKELIPAASQKSAGSKVIMNEQVWKVLSIEEALKSDPQVAFFCAGGDISKEWAGAFSETGCTVIDNSSAWRMEEGIPLVVPEINAGVIASHKLIANPNCSTIQLVLVMAPLHKIYGIKRIVVSTYQSVTGTGIKAVSQLNNERQGIKSDMIYHYPIDKNCIPQCDDFSVGGYTKEEIKMVNETRKILTDNNIAITSTAVRVPVYGGHSESVNVEFERDFDIDDVRNILSNTEGVVLTDDTESNVYPMPAFVQGCDDVFVGRLRRDFSVPNALNLWIVADNLRKGAATNAVQIAEYMFKKGLI